MPYLISNIPILNVGLDESLLKTMKNTKMSIFMH